VRWRIYCVVAFAAYALLSAVDLKLTAALLNANPGAYESNPFAAACLEQHGWQGLAVYKIAGVVAFAGALLLLLRHRPKVASAVVTFGCAVLVAVTTYSLDLLSAAHAEPVQMDQTWDATEYVADRPLTASD
jgi:uncharacterized protein DUF5658